MGTARGHLIGIGFGTDCEPVSARRGWSGLRDADVDYPFSANHDVPADPGGFARVRWNISGFVHDFARCTLLAGFIVLRPLRFFIDSFAAQHLLWGIVTLVTMLLERRTS
jgi:hypothetical protein